MRSESTKELNFHVDNTEWASNIKKTFLNLIPASDITMIQGATAAKILKESRKVIQTNGEWELVDIKVVPSTLVLDEGTFSQIAFYVSTFNYLTSYSVFK